MRFALRSRVVALLKGAAIVASLVALAACAGNPILGDNSPHSGVTRARNLPVQGIDVARYQGNIDFNAVRSAGISFVFMKGTEGKDYIDPMFYENWTKARNAGLPRGAYHFMTWCSTAAEQAAWFEKMVPNDPGALPPVLDLEWNNHSSCTNKHPRADVLEKIKLMLAEMEAHTGKLPIIYTDINFHRDVLAGEYFPNTFWLRSTAAEPHQRYTGRPWTFWQWTQTGTVRGIKGEVDRNSFYGDANAWTNFLLTGCDPRAIAALGPTGRCRLQK